MSPLLHDELRIVLWPDRIALLRTGREMTRHGLARPVKARLVQQLQPQPLSPGEAAWSGAVRAVEAALAGQAAPGAVATVILSNGFVRYALVPWDDAWSGEEEERQLARHCFRQLYGEAAEAWELRVSPGAGGPQLASAVDVALLAALREACARAGVALKSVQPHLMAAYNGCRGRLGEGSAWLAVIEPGHLCLALLRGGDWAWVRMMRITEDWREELPLILEREAYLADGEPATEQVYVWAPGLGDLSLPEHGRWRVENLKPPAHSGGQPEAEEAFAVASVG